MRSSQVADLLPPLHSKAKSFEEQLSESLVNKSSLKIPELIFSPLEVLLVLLSIFIPSLVSLIDFADDLALSLHNCKIVLVSPSKEETKFVVSTDLEKSIPDLCLAEGLDMVALFFPFLKVSKQFLA